MAWDSAKNVLNDAAVELGLYSTDLADPFASTDVNVVLLRRLLKGLGQDLARDFAWTHLQTQEQINTVNGQATYDLPSDFSRLLDGTAWNASQEMPLAGPASPQQWQTLQLVSSAGTIYDVFRVKGSRLLLSPTPTGVETLQFEYLSDLWVTPTGQTDPTLSAPTASTDALWFDRRLLVAGLKLYFRQARGFDTFAEQAAFDAALARAQGGDGAAPVLSLSPRRSSGLVSPGNVPDTGYGS